MMTALLILGSILVICLIASVVLIAVIVCQALQKQADVLDRAHSRWVQSLEPIFDRLMAHNWEEYVTLRTLEGEGEGGFEAPKEAEEEDEGIEQLLPSRWGSLRPASEVIPRPSADEERLLAEDFEDDGAPRRAAL